MNLLFPFSVTLGTAATVLLGLSASQAADAGAQAGFTLLAALAGLAVVEHWLLMLPLPVEKLFRWSLPAQRDAAKSRNSPDRRFDYTTLKTNPTP